MCTRVYVYMQCARQLVSGMQTHPDDTQIARLMLSLEPATPIFRKQEKKNHSL